jgi:hypothetical protein
MVAGVVTPQGQMFAYRVAFPGGLNRAGHLQLRIGCQQLAEYEQKVAEN